LLATSWVPEPEKKEMVRATDLQIPMAKSNEPRSRSRGMPCNGVADHPSTTP
jgi:hypothetical protein